MLSNFTQVKFTLEQKVSEMFPMYKALTYRVSPFVLPPSLDSCYHIKVFMDIITFYVIIDVSPAKTKFNFFNDSCFSITNNSIYTLYIICRQSRNEFVLRFRLKQLQRNNVIILLCMLSLREAGLHLH